MANSLVCSGLLGLRWLLLAEGSGQDAGQFPHFCTVGMSTGVAGGWWLVAGGWWLVGWWAGGLKWAEVGGAPVMDAAGY
ncbi:hypothetical protein MFRU_031g00830 [Monilinia fructicola]|nr:hypothetical protein MFRU_031g00830 [Monilinia fructicola]